MIAGLVILGMLLIVSAIKNTQHELGTYLQADMLGADGYLPWAGAILGIGAFGYLPGMQQASRYLLALLAIVLVIRNGGVFANVETAIADASHFGPAPTVKTLPITAAPAGAASSNGLGQLAGSAASGVASGLANAALLAVL